MTTVTRATRQLRGLLSILTLAGVAVVAATVGAIAAERFSDVPDDHAFTDQIAWMADAGISAGYADGTFRPDDAVTRQAMAAFMQRLGGHDPGVEPVVDAATLQGMTPDELATDLSTLEARMAALEGRVDELEDENDGLRAAVATLESTVAAQSDGIAGLQTLLAGVSRQDDALGRDTLRFEAMNLQVVNGTGTTAGATNALGNLIIGYDTERSSGSDKTGSHYLVVGDRHNYLGYGGILAGLENTASGDHASVVGGSGNVAAGSRAAVLGGLNNDASGSTSAVAGGMHGTASGSSSSVGGGSNNTAGAPYTSVSGGYANYAGADWSSILGGNARDLDVNLSCHPGC